ncbi:hypothetical protein [Methanogenium organophilum]|uniref:Uncharacterized protein n=1 Tax=Methanogenium organophilum TaxID=2199 RepID=A0A9X9T7I6_METOG|nr:hypothetical protein [Methanogenium organophilum]WAI00730.1 hypothetical protein OU421_09890 [Methanogenium organophilum]
MAKQKSAKKNDDWTKTLTRVFVVFILISCVLGFTLTMGFFSIFKTAADGSGIVVSYTIRDDSGVPVLSSEETIIENEGVIAGVSQPMQMVIGQNYSDFIVPIEVYMYPAGVTSYALFEPELTAIADGAKGMHEGDTKTVPFPFGEAMVRDMTAEQYTLIGGNYSEAEIGMWIPLGFAPQPEIVLDNETAPETVATRMAKIVEMENDTLTVQYGYASADIAIEQIV